MKIGPEANPVRPEQTKCKRSGQSRVVTNKLPRLFCRREGEHVCSARTQKPTLSDHSRVLPLVKQGTRAKHFFYISGVYWCFLSSCMSYPVVRRAVLICLVCLALVLPWRCLYWLGLYTSVLVYPLIFLLPLFRRPSSSSNGSPHPAIQGAP